MTTAQPRKSRPRKTFSAFGDIRRMPSDYEVVTHAQNWTMRKNRTSAFEQNPSSPPNLWFLTYRDHSPLQVEDWDLFRDPDALTYRTYVGLQAEAETKTGGVLEQYGDAGEDATLSPGQVSLLTKVFTPSRYLLHGMQQVEAYLGYLAPTSYVTNTAGFATADYLRRVTLVAYRTRELELAHPGAGAGSADLGVWERHEAWQPARKAMEKALVTYDWGEAFTAFNLVLAPTLDDVLLRQFKEVSRDNGDQESWLLSSYLEEDSIRRARWSGALARFALEQRSENDAVLRRWIDRWAPIADAAAAGLGTLLETLPERGRSAAEVESGARAKREEFLTGIFSGVDVSTGEERAGR